MLKKRLEVKKLSTTSLSNFKINDNNNNNNNKSLTPLYTPALFRVPIRETINGFESFANSKVEVFIVVVIVVAVIVYFLFVILITIFAFFSHNCYNYN